MLLQKERERLLAVLQTRTSSHAERVAARQALEADSASDDDGSRAPADDDRRPAQVPEADS